MKTFALIITLCLTYMISSARIEVNDDGGIRFFEGSWSELLETARQEGKHIFVDVYTDWCPPCKLMDREVFPLPEVGDKYNASFLNYKLDAEKGEGIEIAKEFGVRAYPTYLYLDTAGYLLHRAVGFYDAPAFIAHAETALSLDSDENSIGAMEKDFKDGLRDADFLRAYIQRMTALDMDNSEVMNAYFEAIPVRILETPEELVFLGKHLNSTKSKALVFLMANYDKLEEAAKQEFSPWLYSVLYDAISDTFKTGNILSASQLVTFLDMLESGIFDEQRYGMDRIRLMYYKAVKDTAQLKKAGYSMVGNLMDIPLDSIKAENARKYAQVMEPFWKGEQDSTKIDGFEEEKQFLINLYSMEISSKLYEAASAFAETLDAGDPALRDALAWAARCKSLLPTNQSMIDLFEKLEKLTFGAAIKSRSFLDIPERAYF